MLGAAKEFESAFATLNSNLISMLCFSLVFVVLDVVVVEMLVLVCGLGSTAMASLGDPSEEDAIVDRIGVVFLLLLSCDLFSCNLSVDNRIVIGLALTQDLVMMRKECRRECLQEGCRTR